MRAMRTAAIAFCLCLSLASVCLIMAAAQPTEFTNATNQSPPRILGFDLSPREMLITDSPRSVSLQVHVADDDGDLAGISAVFYSPSLETSKIATFNTSSPVSGDSRDGCYKTNLTFSQNSEEGVWTLDQIMVCDGSGGSGLCTKMEGSLVEELGYPAHLRIRNALGIYYDSDELRGWADKDVRFNANRKIIINSIFNRPAICWP